MDKTTQYEFHLVIHLFYPFNGHFIKIQVMDKWMNWVENKLYKNYTKFWEFHFNFEALIFVVFKFIFYALLIFLHFNQEKLKSQSLKTAKHTKLKVSNGFVDSTAYAHIS